MSGTYIGIGGGAGSGGGSAYYVDPVADFASLPVGVPTGTVGLTVDTGVVYWYDGAVWEPIDTELASVAVNDTDSIDHTITGGVLSSDLRLSATAATAGFYKATATIKAGGSPGLHVEIEEASGSQTGVLKSADWTTFNAKVSTSRSISTTAPLSGGGDLSADRTLSIPQANGSTDGYLAQADWTTFNSKEPAITAATTGDYYRGDKSFQPLNIQALSAFANGSSASAGQINEILTGTQAANTATGVGADGVWGNVTSVSLTAGRWAIQGVAGFSENGAVLEDFLSAGISDSATGVGISEFDTVQLNALVSSTADAIGVTPMVYVSIGSTTTYYLNTKFNYSAGSPQHRGRIRAIRIG
jgi:hypothetical protein